MDCYQDGFISIHEAYLGLCYHVIQGLKSYNPQEYDPNKIANITYLKEIPVWDDPGWEYAEYFYKRLVEHGYK